MPNINTRFTLSGEKEYKAAISQIGEGMRVLNSEMRKVESAYARNADSTEALTKKNAVLEKEIDKQKEKINVLREALKKATEAQENASRKFEEAKGTLDENSDEYARLASCVETAQKKVSKWQVDLNNAEAALNKLNNELDDNNEKLEENGEKADGTEKEHVKLGDAISMVAGKLGINLPEGADKALEALNGIDAGTAVTVGGFAALAAAIVKVEKALVDLTKESAENAKEIETFASMTGQSAQDVQRMEYAAGKLGVSYDRIRDSLKEVTNKMQEAQNGSEDTAKAFDTLGVEITNADGSVRSAEDVFLDLLDALGNVENQSERDALAMDLMSESAQELNPIIDAGGETLRGYMQAASDMGYAMEEDELAALVKVKDAFYDLEAQQKATKNQIAAEFAPYLASFYEDVTGGIGELGELIEDSGIVQAFGSILEIVGELLNPSEELADSVIPSLTIVLRPLALMLTSIADTMEIIYGVVNGLNSGDWNKLKSAVNFNHTEKLVNTWEERDRQNSASSAAGSRGGFGGGVATQSVVNNYYTVNGANVRTVNQIADAAEGAQQQNRKFGG